GTERGRFAGGELTVGGHGVDVVDARRGQDDRAPPVRVGQGHGFGGAVVDQAGVLVAQSARREEKAAQERGGQATPPGGAVRQGGGQCGVVHPVHEETVPVVGEQQRGSP